MEDDEMITVTGRLGFNPAIERFALLWSDLWYGHGLHCGDSVEVRIDGEWISDRIEMTQGYYYLVNSGLKDTELENLPVRFKVHKDEC